jgi:hypothetical protein
MFRNRLVAGSATVLDVRIGTLFHLAAKQNVLSRSGRPTSHTDYKGIHTIYCVSAVAEIYNGVSSSITKAVIW